MKNSYSPHALCRFALAAALCALFCLPLPGAANAASLAEEHTVLYYLIEMQRRVTKNCGGRSMAEAPSLMPSETLRGIARQSLNSGTPAEALAASAGLTGVPLLAAETGGGDAQSAFTSLNASQCPRLMGQEYHYIGAAQSGSRWVVILSAAEPGAAAATAGTGASGAMASGASPGTASGGASARTESRAAAPTQTDAAAPPAARPLPGSTGPDKPERPGSEPTYAASPVVVMELEVSPTGDVLGLPRKSAPEVTPFAAPAAPLAPASGGGPDRVSGEPTHAASPVPVGEIRVDAAGRPLGPVRGQTAPSAYDSQSRTGVIPPAGSAARPGATAPVRVAPAEPAPPAPSSAAPGLAPLNLGSGAAGVPSGSSGQAGQTGQAAPSGSFDAPEGSPSADMPPLFVPPQGPGPFGARQTPPPPAAPASGVAPLQDTRPEQPSASIVLLPDQDREEGADPGQNRAVTEDGYTGATAERRMPPPGAAAPGQGATRMLVLVNAARARGGLCGNEQMPPAPALAYNPMLGAAAQAHAQDMTARNFFSSTTPEGVTLGRRVSAAGYVWAFVAEDIAAMDGPEEVVIQSWLAAPRQCRNLLGSEYSEAGFGLDEVGGHWVFTLAAPMMEDGAVTPR